MRTPEEILEIVKAGYDPDNPLTDDEAEWLRRCIEYIEDYRPTGSHPVSA